MSNSRPELALVVPCYNEEATLATCVDKCLALEKHGVSLEIIIVDDCSTDNSAAIAEGLAAQTPQVRYFRQPRNMGKGAALRRGFMEATAAYIGIQDADAEYNPLDYLQMLEPMRAGRADVVYGSRYLRHDTRRVLYFWHSFMNRSLTFVSNMVTNLDITDMETCYKLFRRELMDALAPRLREDRFGFEPEITCLVARARCRVYECAIRYEPRTYEEGKKIGWRDGVRALYCLLHYGMPSAALPMQILMYFCIGSVCALANIILFAIFLAFGMALLPAVVSAFAISAALNYFLCIFLLFQHKARFNTDREVLTYIAGVLLMCGVDYGITAGLTYAGLASVWSKCWATIFGFVGNFLLRKYFVF